MSRKGNTGTVTFESLGATRTRVTVGIDHDTEGLIEQVGTALGVDDRRVKGDLERSVSWSRPAAPSPAAGAAKFIRAR